MDYVLVFVTGGMVGMLVGMAALAYWFNHVIHELMMLYSVLPGDFTNCPMTLETVHVSKKLNHALKHVSLRK